MKRIHLFEFEDLKGFPDWIRRCMTRLILVMHRLLKTDQEIAVLLAGLLKKTHSHRIIDLCSGSGGPMPDVVKKLKKEHGIEKLELTLTDLYPNLVAARQFNASHKGVDYLTQPVDATRVNSDLKGVRTMICSFHHMKPAAARHILEDAAKSQQPLFIYEMSDNSIPHPVAWTAILTNFIMCFFITPFVRPLSLQQIVFTYLIPIIPLFYAWDGAISNMRTYTLDDMDELLKGLDSEHYQWEKGTTDGKMKQLYLIGMPR